MGIDFKPTYHCRKPDGTWSPVIADTTPDADMIPILEEWLSKQREERQQMNALGYVFR